MVPRSSLAYLGTSTHLMIFQWTRLKHHSPFSRRVLPWHPSSHLSPPSPVSYFKHSPCEMHVFHTFLLFLSDVRVPRKLSNTNRNAKSWCLSWQESRRSSSVLESCAKLIIWERKIYLLACGQFWDLFKSPSPRWSSYFLTLTIWRRTRELDRIERVLKKCSKRKGIKGFLLRKDLFAKIKQCDLEISNVLQAFQVCVLVIPVGRVTYHPVGWVVIGHSRRVGRDMARGTGPVLN